MHTPSNRGGAGPGKGGCPSSASAKTLRALVAAIICWTAVPGLVPSPARAAEASRPESVAVIDGNGATVNVRKPVRRIVVEYMDNAELVRILDRVDRVVGVAGYDYIFEKCARQFPEYRRKPSVGLFWVLDYEAVLASAPDLLLTFGADYGAKRANLPGVDVLFLGLYYPDLLDPDRSRFLRGVRNLGLLLDAQEPAQRFIDWHTAVRRRIENLTAAVAAQDKPKVLLSSYPQCLSAGSTYCAYPPGDTLSQACALAGGINLMPAALSGPAAKKASLAVDTEWVMREKPDVIILHAVDRVDEYGYEADDIAALRNGWREYIARPELAGIPAVRDRRVYVFDGHFRNDASGGVVAAAYMAKIFHPEAARDLDPEAIQRQYLAFQRLNYDLDRHGIFVYPPLESEKGLMGIPDRYKGQDF
jgi:iron complex transport system substrate-binding protein